MPVECLSVEVELKKAIAMQVLKHKKTADYTRLSAAYANW